MTAPMIRDGLIDVSELSPYAHDAEAPLWWGMLGLILIEAVVVASIISSYLFIRAQHLEWPPGGIAPPDLTLPLISTAVLIASSLTMHWADTGIKRDDMRRLAVGSLIATLLGVAFLVLKAVEYSQVEYHWDDHVYGSLVWLMVGFHSAHVVAVVLKGLVVNILAWRGYFSPDRRIGVTINGLYWHFVVVIWVPLFITLYLVPRMR